jgi:hypothetical protein
MRRAVLMFLLPAALLAAVDGTVVNGTTGKPQAGAMVTLYRLGAGGPQDPHTVKTDAAGRFTIEATPQGPSLLQTIFDGVIYHQMIPPGTPSTGLQVQIYNAAKKMPGDVRVAQHIIFLEPAGRQLSVSESFFFKNDGKLTYNDPEGGTLRFYLPPEAPKDLKVTVLAPGGMPVERPAEKTARANVYKVDYAVKPGETRFDLSYAIPFADPGTFTGKSLYKGDETRIVVPNGVTIKGDGLESLGQEPSTQAPIYALKTPEFKLELQGTGTLRASQDTGGDSGGGPGIQQILPRVYDNLFMILAPALLALALGFVLLYRARVPARETSSPAPAKGKRRV